MKHNRSLFKPLYSLKNGTQGVLVVLVVLLLNYVGNTFYFRCDLTSDQRYTLSRVTEEALRQIDGMIYIRSFLGGELPLDFLRLRNGLTETLEEYVVRSGRRIAFLHEDPSEISDKEEEIQAYQRELVGQGIEALRVHERTAAGAQSERVVFPGLCLSYAGRTVYVNLLRRDVALSNEQNVSLALQRLEYSLTEALYRLLVHEKPLIGFTTTHGELPPQRTADWERELRHNFRIQHFDTLSRVGMLDSCRFVVVARPTTAFTELEKLVLDQYLMRGGGLLLFVNPVQTSVDSLQQLGRTFASPVELNLTDLLFRYGVRLSTHLLQDAQCAPVPVNLAAEGEGARFTPLPWVYYPLLTPQPYTLLSKNVPLVYSRFPVALELTQAKDSLLKVPFLTSSSYARLLGTPQLIELSEIKEDPQARPMPLSNVPVGVLVEGRFTSAFTHRPLRSIARGQQFDFLPKGNYARMVVFGDGELCANELSYRRGRERVLPLGFDKYTQQTFGNKELLGNITLYLGGQDSLLLLRGREFLSQLLDARRLAKERVALLVLNLTLPTLLLLFLGLLWWWFRWRIYHRG